MYGHRERHGAGGGLDPLDFVFRSTLTERDGTPFRSL